MLTRAVVVTRPTELEQLVARHGTAGQAAFFLKTRGRDIAPARHRHQAQADALAVVQQALPRAWRRARIDRSELDRFAFEPDDVVVAVGQDGLVANVARFLAGQPVIGVDPDPRHNAGVLVRWPAAAVADLLADHEAGRLRLEQRTMVSATLTDGQTLVALNEVFVGHRSHQSARYRLEAEYAGMRHSSSGVIVTTGTGATGWASSIHRSTHSCVRLPGPTDSALAWFAREAWEGPTTSTLVTAGLLGGTQALTLTSEMDEGGTIFGDGIEADHLDFPWGETVRVGVAGRTLGLAA